MKKDEYVYILIEDNDLEYENYSEIIMVSKDLTKVKNKLKERIQVAIIDLDNKVSNIEIDDEKFYVENNNSIIIGKIEKHNIE